MTPLLDRFLELHDGAYHMSWFVGPFADVAAAQGWWQNAGDGSVCQAARDHDPGCRARWHCAPLALSDAEARELGLCDNVNGNLWTLIDPGTPPTAFALERAIAEIVHGEGDDWRFDAATWESWVPEPLRAQAMQQAVYLASAVQYHHQYRCETAAADGVPTFPQVAVEALYTALMALHMPPHPGREFWFGEVLVSHPPVPARPQLSDTLVAALAMLWSTPVNPAFQALFAGIQALVPAGQAHERALERRPQLAGLAVVAQLRAVFWQLLDEVRLTRCPQPWTETELVTRLAQLERWPGRQPRRSCDLCAGQVVETAWLIALVAEADRREVRELLARIPHAVCMTCGVAEVVLPPHASAPRWSHATHDPPPFAAAVLAHVGQVAELAYELDGRGWMVAVRSVWYALTGASEPALSRWQGSMLSSYSGVTVSSA